MHKVAAETATKKSRLKVFSIKKILPQNCLKEKGPKCRHTQNAALKVQRTQKHNRRVIKDDGYE